MNLDIAGLASKTMHFNTAAEVHQDPAVSDLPGNNRYGTRLQLGTFVNLDSRLSVSPIFVLLTSKSLTRTRLAVLVQYLTTSSAEEPQHAFPTTRTLDLRSVYARS